MNYTKHLILIDEKDKTEEIESLTKKVKHTSIKFRKNIQVYTYKNARILVFENPKCISPTDVITFLNGSYLNNIKEILDFSSYIKIIYMSGKSGVYDANRIKFEKNVSNSSNIKVKLNYLKNLAESIQEEDNDFLYNQYKKFDSLSENSILTKYLSSSSVETNEDLSTVVFPFGINLSQEKAVSKALKNNISIIEGPPGTGKTQTILNIIANIMMKNKTIAVVSNNNSALENIFEKFEKENLSFFCAMLGKKDKKEKFIENQKCSYPKLTGIHNIKDYTKVEEIADNIDRVKKILSSKNKIATLKLELKEVKLEKKYFSELYVRKTSAIKGIIRFIFKNSKNILSFLAAVEYLQKRNKNFNIFFKIKSFFKYGVISQSIYKNSLEEVILYLQKSFYNTKEEELSDEIEKIEQTNKIL